VRYEAPRSCSERDGPTNEPEADDRQAELHSVMLPRNAYEGSRVKAGRENPA
jgi:hypothetical protein